MNRILQKTYKRGILLFSFFFFLIGIKTTFSQGGVQFQENKGQWPEEVLFRANLPEGYIYLRPDGLTYDFKSNEDMDHLRKVIHGTYSGEKTDTFQHIIGPGHKGAGQQDLMNNARQQDPGLPELPITIHKHAYQVHFENANRSPQIITEKEQQTKYNYLIGDPSEWGRNVSAFEGVQYKNLYPGTDLHFYSYRGELKYDVIVHPGADPKNIQFRYEGVDQMYLKKKQLYLETSIGTNIELAPYAYQLIDNKRVEVKSKYELTGETLTFKMGAYDAAYPLIIDPNFVFSTFSGSHDDNWGYTATYDDEGNLYMGGIVFGDGYPSTTGAYQEHFAGGGRTYGGGGFDIALSKISPDGKQLVYATYLGGSGDEQPHSLVVNKEGNLIISGRTNSSNFPGKKEGDGGGWDITLSQLTADGSDMVGSLVIGGTGDDGVNIADKYSPYQGKTVISLRRFYGDDARSEVNVDKDQNVYLISSTQSKSDFPITSGVFQPTFGGGLQDAVVIKATPSLSGIVWSSFLGGEENDAAYVLSFAKDGDVYVAGGTESGGEFPGMQGTYQTQNAGRADGFISRISNDGSNLLYSTFLGTNQADQIYGIQVDDEANVYVGGTTEGVWDDFFPDVTHFPENMTNGKQFFAKLSSDLSSLIYTVTFGSKNSQRSSLPNISPTAFLVDRCQNVYMSGWGGQVESIAYPSSGTNGLPKVDPLNLSIPDGKDFYFFVMEKDAKDILFADTYGQNGGFTDHVDGGTSRFDPNGVIYQAICANCGGGVNFPTGPRDVYSPFNGSLRNPSDRFGGMAACNIIGFKIAFNLDGTRGGIAPQGRRSKYCNEEEITFVDTLIGRPAKEWIWEAFEQDTLNTVFGPDTTTEGEFTYEFTNPGRYIVRLIKFNPGDCVDKDTSYTTVVVGDNPAKLDLVTHKLPPCDEFKYAFVNLSESDQLNPIPADLFVWDFGDGTGEQTFDQDSITHSFAEEGSYTVRLRLADTANFCNTPLDTSVVISASLNLEAGIDAPDFFCAPGSYPLFNVSQGGTNYRWEIAGPDGTDVIEKGDAGPVTYNFDQVGEYGITLSAVDSICNLADVATTTVLAYPKPTADFIVDYGPHQPSPPVNAVISFENRSQSHFEGVDPSLDFEWSFGDGITSAEEDPEHLYRKTGIYEVTLVTTNSAGCADTSAMEVEEEIIPKLDMPNAFTPGTPDINGFIGPRAFGVEEVDFKIYNRWGELVFHSTDPDVAYVPEKGWDGTYRGKPQEMDAYAYVLHVLFTDGTEEDKSGSITLIR